MHLIGQTYPYISFKAATTQSIDCRGATTAVLVETVDILDGSWHLSHASQLAAGITPPDTLPLEEEP